jgi:hypothetical protein
MLARGRGRQRNGLHRSRLPRPLAARLLVCVFLSAMAIATGCTRTPTEPLQTLPDGRWSGDGACLSVSDAACVLTVGCGHGQFPRPAIRADGTFGVDGTYQIEVGPIGINPAPPAHFSGTLSRGVLRLTVVPTAVGLPTASYTMNPAATGRCTVPCV